MLSIKIRKLIDLVEKFVDIKIKTILNNFIYMYLSVVADFMDVCKDQSKEEITYYCFKNYISDPCMSTIPKCYIVNIKIFIIINADTQNQRQHHHACFLYSPRVRCHGGPRAHNRNVSPGACATVRMHHNAATRTRTTLSLASPSIHIYLPTC